MNERLKKRLMLVADIFTWSVFVCFGVAVLYFGNWIFVSDKFIIPTESMAPTLIPGDRIVVNKLIFGARIYKNFDFSEGQPLVSWRMPGLRKIRPGDVLVFNNPRGYDRPEIDFKINYVFSKRCIGTPGDSVSIRGGFYVNNRHKGTIGVVSRQERLATTPDSLIPAPVLRSMPSGGDWTIKEFGPLYVPKKGGSIRLDTVLFDVYKSVIQYETGEKLSIVDGGFMLGEKPLSEYVFTENYYFAGGDNVLNSADSRYHGFVPEEFIVGVTRRISYHRDRRTGKFDWNRLWRRIDKVRQTVCSPNIKTDKSRCLT